MQRVPRGASAALAALHLRNPNLELLASLTDSEWRDALDFTDRSQLTLPLRSSAARDAMPQWVRERTGACAHRNLEKLDRLKALYRALDECLGAAGIDYLALKGLAHCPEFGSGASERVQYDIDLYTPKERVFEARDAVMALGFTPLEDDGALYHRSPAGADPQDRMGVARRFFRPGNSHRGGTPFPVLESSAWSGCMRPAWKSSGRGG